MTVILDSGSESHRDDRRVVLHILSSLDDEASFYSVCVCVTSFQTKTDPRPVTLG